MAVDTGINSNSASNNNQEECPLCLEILDIDDKSFYPCTCGYQICRFCWHRIRSETSEECKGSCPACRKPYSENPANFKPLSVEDVQQKIKAQKRQKDQLKKQKTVDSRRHLADLRVVQKNLVFVVGITPKIADVDLLKKNEYFGRFGKIHKIVLNQNQQPPSSSSTTQTNAAASAFGAYITYLRSEDALRAIQSVNNVAFDGKTIKASLGTTKYCSHFMRNQACPKSDCMYLHHQGDAEASFTKEDMQQGKHQEYEKKLIEEFNRNCVIQIQKKISPPLLVPQPVPPQIHHQQELEPEPKVPIIEEEEEEEELPLPVPQPPLLPVLRPATPPRSYQPEIENGIGELELDDLGFDPFYETQKAFEKLIQEEVNCYGFSNHQQQNKSEPPGNSLFSHLINPTTHKPPPPPPGFWNGHHHNHQHQQEPENWMNLDPAIIFSSPTTANNAANHQDINHLLGNSLLNDVFRPNHHQHHHPQQQQQQQQPQHLFSTDPPPHQFYQPQTKVLTSPPPGFQPQQQQQPQQFNNNNFFNNFNQHFPF